MYVTFHKTNVTCSMLFLAHLSILAYLFIPWML